MVDENSLAAANTAEGVVGELTWFLGPVLGFLVLVLSSPEWAFVLNAVTFLLSHAPDPSPAAAPGHAGDRRGRPSGPRTFLGQLDEGLAVVRTSPDLLVLTGLVCAVLFAYGIEQVLHVLVAQDRLGIGANGLGWLTAAIGVGSLLGVALHHEDRQDRADR